MSKERRISRRMRVALDATCRHQGESWEARITNISDGGCGVELPDKLVERGDRLLIELGEDLVLVATVAWAGTRRAGLAFTNPRYGEIIAEFAEQATA
jgi:hypothetical protein